MGSERPSSHRDRDRPQRHRDTGRHNTKEGRLRRRADGVTRHRVGDAGANHDFGRCSKERAARSRSGEKKKKGEKKKEGGGWGWVRHRLRCHRGDVRLPTRTHVRTTLHAPSPSSGDLVGSNIAVQGDQSGQKINAGGIHASCAHPVNRTVLTLKPRVTRPRPPDPHHGPPPHPRSEDVASYPPPPSRSRALSLTLSLGVSAPRVRGPAPAVSGASPSPCAKSNLLSHRELVPRY